MPTTAENQAFFAKNKAANLAAKNPVNKNIAKNNKD